MIVYDATQIRYVIVKTDIGDFQVCPNGTLLMWNEDMQEYRWFDADKFKVGDLREIVRAGFEAMAKRFI